jgi:hypothetical protein
MRPEFRRLVLFVAAVGGLYVAAPATLLWKWSIDKSASIKNNGNMQMLDLNNNVWTYSQCQGRPALFYLFETRCPGTPQNLGLMADLYARFRNTQLCFVPVATDDDKSRVKPWATQVNAPYPVYLPEYNYPDILWPASFVPAMYFVDRNGRVRRPFLASPDQKDNIEKWVEDQLYDDSPESKIPVSSFTAMDPLLAQEDKVVYDVEDEARRLLAAKSFPELDARAQVYRSGKERLPGGLWKLSYFYDGLAGDLESQDDFTWQRRIETLEQWVQSSSESVTARVALARVYKDYAWNARGGGFGASVSDEGARFFNERLVKARDILLEAENLPTKCPETYTVLEHVAVGLGWDRGQLDALFHKAVALEPSYTPLYNIRAWSLQPQWYGSDADVVRSAEEAAQLSRDQDGMGLYARVLWYMTVKNYFHREDLFRATSASWPKMRQGFLDMQKQYPTSYRNLNKFAQFACMAGDKETARTLFEQIGEHFDKSVWGNPALYVRWQRWANEKSWRDKLTGTVAVRQ